MLQSELQPAPLHLVHITCGCQPTQDIAELLAPALPDKPAWSRSLVLGSLQAGTAAVWQHVHGDPCSLELTVCLL